MLTPTFDNLLGPVSSSLYVLSHFIITTTISPGINYPQLAEEVTKADRSCHLLTQSCTVSKQQD